MGMCSAKGNAQNYVTTIIIPKKPDLPSIYQSSNIVFF